MAGVAAPAADLPPGTMAAAVGAERRPGLNTGPGTGEGRARPCSTILLRISGNVGGAAGIVGGLARGCSESRLPTSGNDGRVRVAPAGLVFGTRRLGTVLTAPGKVGLSGVNIAPALGTVLGNGGGR